MQTQLRQQYLKVSIITATYNSAAHIADCVKSVNDRAYSDIEHIIIDGASKNNTPEVISLCSDVPQYWSWASSDDTLEIIQNIPNRVAKIVSEPDKGIY